MFVDHKCDKTNAAYKKTQRRDAYCEYFGGCFIFRGEADVGSAIWNTFFCSFDEVVLRRFFVLVTMVVDSLK